MSDIFDHDKCRISRDVSGELTVGQGCIDEYGFFEFPCELCLNKLQSLFCNEIVN